VLYQKDAARLDQFKAGKFKSATCVVTYRTTLITAIEEYVNANEGATLPYLSLNDPMQIPSLLSVPAIMILLTLGFSACLFIFP
jgi:hypothetical protein